MPQLPNRPYADTRHRFPILALLWLAGIYLRLPVLVAPPLVPFINADLPLDQAQLGALTTLPVLMLSIGALPGALVISRLGPRVTLVLCMLVVACASMGRGLAPPVWVMFAATAILGLAIAVMQPAFPALLLRWCPEFAALGSAVYMNGMLMGEFIGGGLTLPAVMPLIGNDWRTALLVWSLPALPIAGLVLFGPRLGIAEAPADAVKPGGWRPPLHKARTWHLGIILGAGSSGFFGTNAYLSALLHAKGMPHALPEYLLVFNGTQVLGSIAMLLLAKHWVGRRGPVIAMAWGVLLALIGIVLAQGIFAIGAATLLGLATCMQLILIVALVPQIASAREAAALAAGMFMVGYLLGFAVPLAGGFTADALGDARAAFIPLALLAAIGVAVAHRSPHLASRAKSHLPD